MKRCKNNMPLEERLLFMSEVNPTTGCREWTRSKSSAGYGWIQILGKPRIAHRVAYELWVGHIPNGLFVCHTCDNRACIEPSHLFVGTNQDNIDDMDKKGRRASMAGEKNSRAKLSNEQVYQIRAIVDKSYFEIADMFGIKKSQVGNIRLGKSWKHLLPKESAINQSV